MRSRSRATRPWEGQSAKTRPPDAVVACQLGRGARLGMEPHALATQPSGGQLLSATGGRCGRLVIDNRRIAAGRPLPSIPQGYQHRTRRHWYARWMRSRLEGEAICQF